MADEIVINGLGNGRESKVDDFRSESRVVELIHKVKFLELKNAKLALENDEARERNNELMIKIEMLKGKEEDMRGKLEGMRLEIESAEDGRREMDSTMKRPADLEINVVRLQHNLISVTHEVEEVNGDVVELCKVVEEKDGSIAGLGIEAEALRKGKVESEKVMAEMELLSAYEKKVEVMEIEIEKSKVKLEKVKKDKTVLEDTLKESEEKSKKLELKRIELQRELEVVESTR